MAIQKILIVDDSPTERYYLTDILVRNGFTVTTADNGEEALAKIRADRPQLILMDVVMPGANGFQVTRSIARDPELAVGARSSSAAARTRKPTASGACARARRITSSSRSTRRRCWPGSPRSAPEPWTQRTSDPQAAAGAPRLRQYQEQLLERMQAARTGSGAARAPAGRRDRRRALPARPARSRRDRAGAAADRRAADAALVPGPGEHPRQPGRRGRPGALSRSRTAAGTAPGPARAWSTFAPGLGLPCGCWSRACVGLRHAADMTPQDGRLRRRRRPWPGRRWRWPRWRRTSASCRSASNHTGFTTTGS